VQLAWQYPPRAESIEGRQPLRGCPAIDDQGRLFVCIDSQLLMFSAGSSAPQWKYVTAGLIPHSPAIGPDNNVRVHSCDGHLHVVDPDGHRVFDPVVVGEPLGWASPLVDPENNTWICRHEGGLARVGPSGQVASRPFLRTRRRFDCTGLIHGGILYVGSDDHYLIALPITGDLGQNSWENSADRGRTCGAIHSPVALTGAPELLVVSQDDHLYSFSLDGQQRWAVPLPGQALGSPVVDEDGTIYLGISQTPRNREASGILLAIDPVSHQVKWQYRAEAPIESTPVIGDDGILYFGDNGGTIHAIDGAGKRIWTAEFESPVRSAGTIIAEKLVAFGLDNASFVVLKCSSRRLRPKGWPKLLGARDQTGLAPAD